MTAVKQTTTKSTIPTYHVSGPSGSPIHMAQLDQDGTLRLTAGGNTITFSQQNIIDLLAPLTAYANTGRLS